VEEGEAIKNGTSNGVGMHGRMAIPTSHTAKGVGVTRARVRMHAQVVTRSPSSLRPLSPYTLIFHLRLLLSFSPRISATLGLLLMPLGAPASPSAHTVASGVATMRFGRRAQQHAPSVPPPASQLFRQLLE